MPKKKPKRRKTGADAQKANANLTRAKAGGLQQGHVSDSTRQDIIIHAREGFAANPKVEVCGFIATNGKKQKAFRSPNISGEPEHAFRTCPKTWRKVESSGWNIVAVYHSHNSRSPAPSDGDKYYAEAAQLPFVIVGMPTEVFAFHAPTGWEAPLEGRPFVFGVLDCRTLHRDYYKRELGIIVPDFEYDSKFWEAKDGKSAQDLFEKFYKEAGFVEVDTLQKHDTILMQIPPSTVRNHCAIFTGDGQILHHLSDRLSKREPYIPGVGYGRAVKIVRHESLM